MDYVELHARSAFSFLRGGSSPEALIAECARLNLPALALCDRNGLYGAVRNYTAAKEAGLRAIVGAEVALEDGAVVPLLVATREGYQNLCQLLTAAKLRAPKGAAAATWGELRQFNAGLIALTGDEEGPVRGAWRRGDTDGMDTAVKRLLEAFGPDRVFVEVQRHLLRDEDIEEAALVAVARAHGLPLLATNGALYATRDARKVADVFTCLRHHRTLDQAGRLLAVNGERHLKNAPAMHALFADLAEAAANTVLLAERLEFTLENLGYRFPDYPVPAGETMDSFLHKMTYFGAQQRYGSISREVRRQLERELALITKLGFSGYFLVVWDLCSFCRERGILVQGRGSAANSAVCYALGITAVDPVGGKLLFERFLSEGRTDWPDIDLDLPSRERREQVIQEVYRRYGRSAAMTANVITYRSRSAMREAGKVLGFPDDVLDRYTSLFAGGDYPHTLELEAQLRLAGITAAHPRTPVLIDLVQRIRGLPRHLGQHSGGMVLCAGSLDRIVPLENATMPGRVVIEWDKSDCEDMGIVKVDLLGLGMMAVLEESLATCQDRGHPVDLARIPKDDPATFALLQQADTVGVFQVESRAQMATLPRMKPENFYDLAVEVAIIRPGPIQGKAVHPYLERRAGRQDVTYLDERARPILERTLGVVLFQEQILRLAMELGGFSAAEADELRRAIGFTRSPERLQRMEVRLRSGLQKNGMTAGAIEDTVHSLATFALYGFPESHAISFALIAYASAYLKVHRPAEFYAALLNNQPMGFYSPATIVQDARRHGVTVRPVCVQASRDKAAVEGDDVIRVGFASLRGLRTPNIEHLLAERSREPFASVDDFVRRTRFSEPERRLLASAGALNLLAGDRRHALWAVARNDLIDDLLANALAEDRSGDALVPMTLAERVQEDYRSAGLTTGSHPMHLLRAQFPDLWRADELPLAANGARIRIGGSVITRQRPGTAKGVVFVSLEDETGIANAIVRPPLFERQRLVITQFPALIIEGRVQAKDGVIHVLAENFVPLRAGELPAQASHDFR